MAGLVPAILAGTAGAGTAGTGTTMAIEKKLLLPSHPHYHAYGSAPGQDTLVLRAGLAGGGAPKETHTDGR
jgi:hypothetical protein